MAKKSNSTLWHTDETVVENQQAPSIKRSFVSRKWARRGINIIAFVGVPLSLAINANAILDPPVIPKPPALADASLAVNGSLGKTPAVEAMHVWLAGTISPLPGGRLSSWDGYETVKKPKPINEAVAYDPVEYDTEIHHFTLTSGSGDTLIQFSSTIEVLVDAKLGTHVTSTPTLIPQKANKDGFTAATWLGYPGGSATPKSVTDAVTAWADAFASGKAEVLRLAVGDKDAGHAYLPLSGVTSVTVNVIAASPVPLPDPKAVPEQMLVRVALSILWDGQTPPENGDTSGLPVITYDLLINDADSAAPRVVSWGGPGSGPSLKPYGPAVDGVDADAAKPTTAPVTPGEETPVETPGDPAEPIPGEGNTGE